MSFYLPKSPTAWFLNYHRALLGLSKKKKNEVHWHGLVTVEGIDKNPNASYLWFVISTLPYCSIQSLPTMMLCTQHVGFVHVYASPCLENKNQKPRGKKKRETLFCFKSAFVSNAITQDNKSKGWTSLSSKTSKPLLMLTHNKIGYCLTFLVIS